ncbi:hypothetical protein [Chromobacterium haemolyticum]|uniref:hypothetical protein n=1 Tax=Chromobacterium haemolyticum TaxID=394935 RepID=UPI0009DA3095|nr:hypothetical protein [Chromobacterium haemolyticum]OQS32108.1 hypothetical protein B0T39_23035 [Chromobacterium haemolyticum]
MSVKSVLLRENTLKAAQQLETAKQAVCDAVEAEYPVGTIIQAKIGRATITAQVKRHRGWGRPGVIVITNLKTRAEREINASLPELYEIEINGRP